MNNTNIMCTYIFKEIILTFERRTLKLDTNKT